MAKETRFSCKGNNAPDNFITITEVENIKHLPKADSRNGSDKEAFTLRAIKHIYSIRKRKQEIFVF